MAAVYRDFDQAALDAQYNLRAAVPEHADIMTRWAADSTAARSALPCRLDLRYGPQPLQTLDAFPSANAAAPILVFIHGGYWRTLDKSDFSYLAPAFVEAGVTFVSVNYGLAPDTAMDDIVDQACAAVAWVKDNARSLGGDGNAVFLAGHSAGAHLCAMALTRHRVRGAILVSGVYDLEPVRLTPYVNDDLRLDAETAKRNSPVLLKQLGDAPLVVAAGEAETAEFIRQSESFAEAWGAANACLLPGRDHFTAADALGNGDNGLFDIALDLIDGRLSRP